MAGFGLVMGVGWAHERFDQRGITEVVLDWLVTDIGDQSSWSVH